MTHKNILAQVIWEEDAGEVLDFLNSQDFMQKEEFRNSDSLMNYTSQILTRRCDERIDKKATGVDFWAARKMSIRKDIEFKRRARNILYLIRVLNGTFEPYAEEPQPEYDFESEKLKDREEEDFWEEAEKRREPWHY